MLGKASREASKEWVIEERCDGKDIFRMLEKLVKNGDKGRLINIDFLN